MRNRIPNPAALTHRGAPHSPAPRYLDVEREDFDDGWGPEHEPPARVATTVTIETARTIISRNQSPDVPFTQSINPYRGCEHGCVYCYARPTHAYLDLSPGLDFETKLFAKTNAVALLRSELAAQHYQCSPIALGANTDPYQPIERKYRITREILEVLAETRHPVTIVTKGALVERDIDLLAALAAINAAQVFISITTLDTELARRLEPRATAPLRRVETVRRLADAGIPVGVLVAPTIPGLNDNEMESILEAATTAGARTASYIAVRLPREVNPLFQAWLVEHVPLRAAKIMNLIRDIRGGRDNDPKFGRRMTGQGTIAALLAQRFARATKRLGLDGQRAPLAVQNFIPPQVSGAQLALF